MAFSIIFLSPTTTHLAASKIFLRASALTVISGPTPATSPIGIAISGFILILPPKFIN